MKQLDKDKELETLTESQYDWSTLQHLAQRVIKTSSLAVMTHGELNSRGRRDRKVRED